MKQRTIREGALPEATDDSTLDRRLLAAITQAQSRFVERKDSRQAFEGLLESLLELTNSEYGFIGEVLTTADGDQYLKTHAITDISWNDETREFYENNINAGLEFHNLDNLFGAVIRTGKPVMANAPQTDPRSGGLPKDHPALNAFLGLPFYSREEMVGMVGVANRPGGYDDGLNEFLSPFLVTCSNIIVALRAEIERAKATERLREGESRVRAILDGAIDAIITIDETGIIESYNPATSRLFGYGDSELIGKNVSLLMPEPHRSQHGSYLDAYLRTGHAKVIGVGREAEGIRKDGSLLTVELAVNRLELGGRTMFVGILRDISDRKAAEQQLHRLNEELSRRVEDLHKLDHENSLLGELGSFLQACRSAEEAHQVLTACAERLLPGFEGAYYQLEEQGLAARVATWGDASEIPSLIEKGECWALRRGEAHFASHEKGSLACSHSSAREGHSSACAPVMTQDGPIGLITIEWSDGAASGDGRGISTERSRALLNTIADRLGTALSSIRLRMRLEEDSIRDPLTRLYNRRFMDDWLRRELRRATRNKQPISVILADIDHFKVFNDQYGHDMGDRILRLVSQEMMASLREEDVVCRMGGEEFVLLLPGADLDIAATRAEQVRRRIERMRLTEGDQELPPLTISLGATTSPAFGLTGAELIKSADAALYRAKQAGRNRVEIAKPPATATPMVDADASDPARLSSE